MSIGVFGGTFDPPHVGHLILADEAQTQLGLTRVLWVLTAAPPHKTIGNTLEINHRLDMLSLAIQNNNSFELSRVDIDRPLPHFSVDTVRLLSQSYPDEPLIYLMGGDSLRDLPTWHDPERFVNACSGIGVMRRPGDKVDLELLYRTIPSLREKLQFVIAPLLNISSSEIRMRVEAGQPYRYFLPQGVYTLINERNLYRK